MVVGSNVVEQTIVIKDFEKKHRNSKEKKEKRKKKRERK